MDYNLPVELIVLTILFCVRNSNQCEIGEPTTNPRETVPDLNITLSDDNLYIGDQLIITCIADKPRYDSQLKFSASVHPFLVEIFFPGNNVVKPSCPRSSGKRIVCSRTVLLKNTGKLHATCKARNNDGCRVKSLVVTVLERPIQSSPSMKEGSTTNVTSSPTAILPSTSIVGDRDVTSSPTAILPSTSIVGDKDVTSSVKSMPPSTSIVEKRDVISSPTSIFSSTSIVKNRDGSTGEQEENDEEDEVDDVKKLVTAALILVVVTLVLVISAILYIICAIKH